mmetsp:Transcript_18396/g.36078  ORF Transcript_18396/g.36078 Transcript_18396/m.36078 type:complete len:104 (-) Transcript_18396:151-462(-)
MSSMASGLLCRLSIDIIRCVSKAMTPVVRTRRWQVPGTKLVKLRIRPGISLCGLGTVKYLQYVLFVVLQLRFTWASTYVKCAGVGYLGALASDVVLFAEALGL